MLRCLRSACRRISAKCYFRISLEEVNTSRNTLKFQKQASSACPSKSGAKLPGQQDHNQPSFFPMYLKKSPFLPCQEIGSNGFSHTSNRTLGYLAHDKISSSVFKIFAIPTIAPVPMASHFFRVPPILKIWVKEMFFVIFWQQSYGLHIKVFNVQTLSKTKQQAPLARNLESLAVFCCS